MTMKEYQAAYSEGIAANEEGQIADANPYWEAGHLRSGWLDGFNAGQAVREEWEEGNHHRARLYA